MWDEMSRETERFLQAIMDEMEAAAAAFVEASEQISEQVGERVYEAIAPTAEQFAEKINEFVDPWLSLLADLSEVFDESIDETSNEESLAPLTSSFTAYRHSVCLDCCHYHGQMYGNNFLVCAMHPYGVPEGEATCPDKKLRDITQNSASYEDPFEDTF
jgi:hypothetical protein